MAERDFDELLRLFNKLRVRYCIVGAHAVAIYARPRYTKDLDIWVEPSLENGQKIVDALKAFGFGALNITPKDFARPGRFIQLGYEPVRIDLITDIGGVTFEEAWRHRESGLCGSVKAWFIGRSELIRNKEHTGRPQDQADLAWLRPSRRTSKSKHR